MSSFSVEDLPSNKIGFYRAVKGYTKEQIRDFCVPVGACVAKRICKNIGLGGCGTNTSWRPKYFHDCTEWECLGTPMTWPDELDDIKPDGGQNWGKWRQLRSNEQIPQGAPVRASCRLVK